MGAWYRRDGDIASRPEFLAAGPFALQAYDSICQLVTMHGTDHAISESLISPVVLAMQANLPTHADDFAAAWQGLLRTGLVVVDDGIVSMADEDRLWGLLKRGAARTRKARAKKKAEKDSNADVTLHDRDAGVTGPSRNADVTLHDRDAGVTGPSRNADVTPYETKRDETRRDETGGPVLPGLDSSASPSGPRAIADWQAMKDDWQGLARSHPAIKGIRSWTADRKKAMAARAKDMGQPIEDAWAWLLREIEASAFLRGEAERSKWAASLDWALKPKSWAKIREGIYRDREERKPAPVYIPDYARPPAPDDATTTQQGRDTAIAFLAARRTAS